MKKQILNIGKALNRAEQRQINGGNPNECNMEGECPEHGPDGGWCCDPNTYMCVVGFPQSGTFCY